MERVELKAQSRTVIGKQVRQMRGKATIPAVVYGHGAPAAAIQAEERSLSKALRRAGGTSLIELFIDEEPKPQLVLAREIQRNPLNGRLLHVDFYQVRLTEKVKTNPRLEFIGESPLVKSGKGVMIHNMTEVEIECLPTDLISVIRVDVSHLENMDDNIVVADLPIPPGITVLADRQEIVASVVPTRAVALEEAEEAAVAVAAPAEEEEE